VSAPPDDIFRGAGREIAMLRFKQAAGVVINTAIFAAMLLIPAGTLEWPRAWIFLAVVAVAATVSILAIPEDLLNERYKPGIQKSQPLADKLILVAFISSFVATIVLIPLDVFRFHLMDPPPMALSVLGLIMFATGWWLISMAMIENAFAAPVVKLQKERGQHVIDSGPYRIVRHPMYSSVIPLLVGMALWFGSYAAAIASIVPTALIAVRIMFEERFLCRELPGYAEYAARTRFRLVPFVW
jgi:protein-S-isoprenylcysteine O-methyltransferase Ste14